MFLEAGLAMEPFGTIATFVLSLNVLMHNIDMHSQLGRHFENPRASWMQTRISLASVCTGVHSHFVLPQRRFSVVRHSTLVAHEIALRNEIKIM